MQPPVTWVNDRDGLAALPQLSIVQFRGMKDDGGWLAWQLDEEWFAAGNEDYMRAVDVPPEAFPAAVLWTPDPLDLGGLSHQPQEEPTMSDQFRRCQFGDSDGGQCIGVAGHKTPHRQYLDDDQGEQRYLEWDTSVEANRRYGDEGEND